MLSALLVDKDQRAIIALEVMLDRYCPQVSICGKVTTVNDAMGYLYDESNPDIIFSEVDLPNDSGFKFTERNITADYELIFVAENPTYALKAIKRQVAGFLVKPVKEKELLHAVHLAEERIHQRKLSEINRLLLKNYEMGQAQKDAIGIPTIEGFEIIHPEDIIRCEGMQNCTRIITKDRSDIISSYNLGKFIKLFGEELFFSPHKSHLVNIHHIKKYLREGTIIMVDGSNVPVSKRRKVEILKYFKHL
jgi:two-component system LytT family response regulator